MTNTKSLNVLVALSLLFCGPALAEAVIKSDVPAATMVTVYQGPMSLFSESHDLSLGTGPQTLNLTNLPSSILPESIMLDVPDGAKVDKFSYSPPAMTPQGILVNLVGHNIGWADFDKKTGKKFIRQGTLISAAAGIVIKFGDAIEINPPGHLVLKAGLERAMPRSGISASLTSQGGNIPVSLGYLAGGLSWQANYVIMLASEGNRAKLNGKMSITNQTGKDLTNTKIRLVAGHMNMSNPRPMLRGAEMAMMASPVAGGVSGKSAFDAHIYNLQGTYNIANTSMLAVPFITSDSLQIRKRYVLEGFVRGNPEPSGESGQFVAPEIRFSLKNEKAAGLGVILPAGSVRVMAMQDGAPMLLGEDRITHTPIGEAINLRTGRAFDVTAKRKQTSFTPGKNHNDFKSSYEITLNNTNSTGIVVDVVDRLPGQWKITSESLRHVKRDAATAIWSVPVPANGNVTLSYGMETRR